MQVNVAQLCLLFLCSRTTSAGTTHDIIIIISAIAATATITATVANTADGAADVTAADDTVSAASFGLLFSELLSLKVIVSKC